MTRKPKAILFDLDNTLTDRGASVTRFARQFHVDFRDRHQMTRREDMVPIIHNADGGGYRPLDERWRGLQKWIPWKDKPTTDELRDYWYSELGKHAVGVNGLHEALSVFLDINIKMGIITNGPEYLQNHTIDTLQLRSYMSTVLISDTVGVSKPDPEIYQLALNDLKMEPADVWFVGDNPATDLLGGYNMGMKTVWVRGYHAWTDEGFQADYTVQNISELLSIIAPQFR